MLVALAAFLLMKQQERFADKVSDLLSKRIASLERPSFFLQRRKKLEEERSVEIDDDASASTSTSSTSSSSAADEEELAAQARSAAEKAAVTSSGPSGFITSEEWEEALLLASKAQSDDSSSSSSSSSASASLASLEASIRARAGAAARGALLADAASLPWQGVPRRAVLETLRRCPEAAERRPEFFEGGSDSAEEGEDDDRESSSSPSAECPLASALPRSYPGETTAGSFSALGYETLPLLQSLMASNGFDSAHYASAAAAFFSRTPGHVNALPRRVTAAAVLAEAGGERAARSAAEDSSASSAVVKVAPLVARFAGTPKLRKAVAGAVAVHQRSRGKQGRGGAAAARAAAGAAAAVLERVVVLGESVPEAVVAASKPESSLSDLARSYLREALVALESEDKDAALLDLLLRNAGRGDGGEQGIDLEGDENGDDSGSWDTAPAALKGALAASLLHPQDFAAAVRSSMLAGGDAAARAHLVGAFLGAATAAEEAAKKKSAPFFSSSPGTKTRPPPGDWRPRVEKAVQADAMVHLILHQRGERVPVAMPGERVPGAEEQ